jgi:hypothetical protein
VGGVVTIGALVVGGAVAGGLVVAGEEVLAGLVEVAGPCVFVGDVVGVSLELFGVVESLEGCVEGVPVGGSVTTGSIEMEPSIVVVVADSPIVVATLIGCESPGESGTAMFEPPPRLSEFCTIATAPDTTITTAAVLTVITRR